MPWADPDRFKRASDTSSSRRVYRPPDGCYAQTRTDFMQRPLDWREVKEMQARAWSSGLIRSRIRCSRRFPEVARGSEM